MSVELNESWAYDCRTRAIFGLWVPNMINFGTMSIELDQFKKYEYRSWPMTRVTCVTIHRNLWNWLLAGTLYESLSPIVRTLQTALDWVSPRYGISDASKIKKTTMWRCLPGIRIKDFVMLRYHQHVLVLASWRRSAPSNLLLLPWGARIWHALRDKVLWINVGLMNFDREDPLIYECSNFVSQYRGDVPWP